MFGIGETVHTGAGLPVKVTRAFASVRRLTGRQRPALCGSRADRSSTAMRESSKREIRLALSLREVNASRAERGVAFRTRARKLTGSLSVWQPRLNVTYPLYVGMIDLKDQFSMLLNQLETYRARDSENTIHLDRNVFLTRVFGHAMPFEINRGSQLTYVVKNQYKVSPREDINLF
jgi:hypothetical protein